MRAKSFLISHRLNIILTMIAFVSLFTTNGVMARSFRVDMIPNGNKFSCANCHINPAGGGTRNAFGKAVEQLVTPGAATPFWGLALATLDSDGDGVTNGAELQDPNGTWQPGDAQPGVLSKVTNPGVKDAVAVPTSTPTPLPIATQTPIPLPTATSTPTPLPTPTLTPTPIPFDIGHVYVVVMTGSKENPPIQTTARGYAILQLNKAENTLLYSLYVFDTQNVTASHIQLGSANENGKVVYPLQAPVNGKSGGQLDITPEDVTSLKTGNFYVNVHTTQNPGGEMRGQVVDKPLEFKASLSGAEEIPPVTVSRTGEAKLTLSGDLKTLGYTVTVSNLDNITAAHIHNAPKGQNGPVIIPIASAPFTTISGEAALTSDQLDALFSENLYVNVHTTQNPGGAIRGQIILNTQAIDAPAYVQAWERY